MVAEQINQIVDMVAEKLGVAVEAVYPMLIKQAEVFCGTYHVSLWVAGIAFVMMLVCCVLFIIADNNRWNEVFEVIAVVGLFVFGIVLIISALYCGFEFTDYMTALHNPEWWAIEYVTKLVK